MVVSLYVCQIPENVTKEDIINVFREVSGYIDTRIKIMSDRVKIAFIDFEDEKNANFAKETLQGFKFTKEDKGLIIKFSENSRFSKSNKLERKNNKDKNYRGRKRIRSLSKEKKNKNNNNLNENSKNQNNSKNLNNNDINNQLESLVNNPLLKLIEQSTKNSTNQNQTPQNQLLKNLTLLASIQNTNFNNNIQNNNLNLNHLDNLLSKYENDFSKFESLKNKATNIVYVEGIPVDAKEREVAHIFRPFPGYRSLRLIEKEKNGENTILCFADFENVIQSTICINTLQGYRFDKNDLVYIALMVLVKIKRFSFFYFFL